MNSALDKDAPQKWTNTVIIYCIVPMECAIHPHPNNVKCLMEGLICAV